MNTLTIWAYVEQEISDLKPMFEDVFNVRLTRDYENVWEWIWNGNDSKNQINISREHNMKSGDYNKPLRIKLNWENQKIEKEVIIKQLQTILKTQLLIGEIENIGRENSDYIIQEIIEYEL